MIKCYIPKDICLGIMKALLLFCISLNAFLPAFAYTVDAKISAGEPNSSKAYVYEFVDNNVPYSTVDSLPSREHDTLLKYGDDKEQAIRIWLPKSASKFRGTVALIHGGCWLAQFDYTHTKALSTALSNAGYLVWNIEYRRAGNDGEWPTATNDIFSAMKRLSWVSENQFDDQHIYVVGHSAGGHLAYMVGAKASDLFVLERQYVKVIGLGAIIDVHQYARGDNSCQTATPLFMQGMPIELPQQYHIASPLSYPFIESEQLSFALLHGSADSIVPVSFGQHHDVQQDVIDGVGHFDWIHPGSPAFKLLLDALKP